MRIAVPEAFETLAGIFERHGHELRIVGGWVRDTLAGSAPKDLDLATDASPARQAAVYAAAGLRHLETGLKHGTLTAILDGEPHEVTTLRTEANHDGRHAEVSWTHDWDADLARRDLTINAMAVDRRGALHDPHGGAADLEDGRVRFVGDPDERLVEDRLRGLRWHRFQARYGASAPDAASRDAVSRHADGLVAISAERKWSEIARILTGPRALRNARLMEETGVAQACGIEDTGGWAPSLEGSGLGAAAMLVAWAMGPDARRRPTSSGRLRETLRLSRAEGDEIDFLVGALEARTQPRRALALDGVERRWACDLAVLRGEPELARALAAWDVPKPPLAGADLVAAGLDPGPSLGAALRRSRVAWADSGYVLDKERALDHALGRRVEPGRTPTSPKPRPPSRAVAPPQR